MRLHFIAIGGSAMHNLAIALSKKGYRVTGSDDVVYEPSKTRLEKYDLLPKEMGWNPERINTDLDAVILGMHAREDNPELVRAQELGIKIYSYPDYIYEQSKKKTRVVVGGSHGKTTITSMILHVLSETGMDCDYLVGAQLKGFDTMVKLTDSAPVIIIEGDEYLASPIDRRPKFHIYKADIAILSGIAWDHINVFPTFENYKDQFAVFIETVSAGGTLIYCQEDPVLDEVVNNTQRTDISKVPYGTPEYKIEDGITELITTEGDVALNVFGKHNLLNLNAARLACKQLGVAEKDFYQAIASFQGAARRLEILGKNKHTAVFKDFAHSPSKLKATIEAVKQQYPRRELVSVIELHTFSSLNRDFLQEYHGSMDLADYAIVFIDEHIFSQKRIEPYGEDVVKRAFGNDRLIFFNNPDMLVGFLNTINYKGKNLLLMSSGNFAGIDLGKLTQHAINE